jgi:hypothetical protein
MRSWSAGFDASPTACSGSTVTAEVFANPRHERTRAFLSRIL